MVSHASNNAYDSNSEVIQPANNNIQNMPPEIMLQIFSNLDPQDLPKCDLVSRRWLDIARDSSLVRVPNIAFGKEKWEKHIGKIGNEPPLPRNIKEILEAPCPIFGDGKKVKDTHMLVLIPKTVNGKPLTLNALEKIFKNQKVYKYYSDDIKDQHGEKAIEKSHWVLMAKEVMLDSLGKTRNEQIGMAKVNPNYRAPTILEAAVCILTHYVATVERLFTGYPWRYTCCQETVNSFGAVRKTIVGGFNASGLGFFCSYDDGGYDYTGVAPLREV